MLLGREVVLLLNVEARDGAAVLLTNRRLQILIARQLLHRSDGMFQFKSRGNLARDQFQCQLRRPDFQRRGVLAHIGIADDEMEPSIFFPNRVRFVPRIQNRPVVHRVDAQIRLHEVGSLRQLIMARHEPAFLTFHTDFAGSSNDLPADKERQQPRSQRREGNRA